MPELMFKVYKPTNDTEKRWMWRCTTCGEHHFIIPTQTAIYHRCSHPTLIQYAPSSSRTFMLDGENPPEETTK